MAHLAIWRILASLEGVVALVFDGTAATSRSLHCPERGSAQGGAFRTHIKTEVNTQGLILAMESGCCLWGIQR